MESPTENLVENDYHSTEIWKQPIENLMLATVLHSLLNSAEWFKNTIRNYLLPCSIGLIAMSIVPCLISLQLLISLIPVTSYKYRKAQAAAQVWQLSQLIHHLCSQWNSCIQISCRVRKSEDSALTGQVSFFLCVVGARYLMGSSLESDVLYP